MKKLTGEASKRQHFFLARVMFCCGMQAWHTAVLQSPRKAPHAKAWLATTAPGVCDPYIITTNQDSASSIAMIPYNTAVPITLGIEVLLHIYLVKLAGREERLRILQVNPVSQEKLKAVPVNMIFHGHSVHDIYGYAHWLGLLVGPV